MSEEAIPFSDLNLSEPARQLLATVKELQLQNVDIEALPLVPTSKEELYMRQIVARSGQSVIYKRYNSNQLCTKDFRFRGQEENPRFEDPEIMDLEILNAIIGHLVAEDAVTTPKPVAICIDPMTNRLVGFQMELIEGTIFPWAEIKAAEKQHGWWYVIRKRCEELGVPETIRDKVGLLQKRGIVVDTTKAAHDPKGDNIQISVKSAPDNTYQIEDIEPIFFDLSFDIGQYQKYHT